MVDGARMTFASSGKGIEATIKNGEEVSSRTWARVADCFKWFAKVKAAKKGIDAVSWTGTEYIYISDKTFMR